MWQRGLNWAAVAFVGIFGLMWVGVVIYADAQSALWMRAGETIFGLLLTGWAVQRAAKMIIRA
ncbi:hypothetical protein GCM10010486_86490 [Nonomuraea roseoviolacea subsp. carminata]|uniref:Uncharacterized protein n=1 Tax=Nonomuraea roseoviolacea subsp. carminata TaxID=160689 RepID=A0ABT1K402_9ACTN|nr:hypothetical protein [Nonomuraea roseoviolacea subsp. carminata]